MARAVCTVGRVEDAGAGSVGCGQITQGHDGYYEEEHSLPQSLQKDPPLLTPGSGTSGLQNRETTRVCLSQPVVFVMQPG